MLRIISINNLSAGVYRLCAPRFDHSVRFETPARVHNLVAGGHCDAALLPVASLPELSHRMEPVGRYGIACRGAVRSVQLFSGAPLDTLLRERKAIYATPKSKTSVRLFETLCRQQYGLAPVLSAAYPGSAAQLLIGDAAFECAHTQAHRAGNIDLGAWWQEQTGLPFVYARWVVSRSLSARQKCDVADWLEACSVRATTPGGTMELALGDGNPDDISDRREYYRHVHPRLAEDDLAGLSLFLKLMEGTRHECAARIA